ncbi:MAG TPA: GNAT family N-acetyltransferase [Solirubrobacteraceae bacterium]|nr:GNAT family N-acetyltransferase [Solirubrobacteraceae bacterium]
MALRHADPARDGADCAEIYAPAVNDGATSFEEPPAPDAAAMAARIAATSRTHPWLVIEDGGRVVAYAYAAPHHERAAYRWAATVSVFVDPDHRRRGAGRRLYLALFELMRAQGLRIAVAAITLPNEASIALHRSVGFEPVGTYRRIGWKAGAWRDVSWWELRLGPDDDGRPADPGPPRRLA